MLILFLQAMLIIVVLVTLLWLLSIVLKNVSIVDLFWGFGFVVVNTFYFFSLNEPNARQLLVAVLVAVWGLRLSIYLSWRNIGKGEDFRYQEFRRTYSRNVTGGLAFFKHFYCRVF